MQDSTSSAESNSEQLLLSPGLTRIVSRDEMNLAEFPLTVLSTRVNSNQKTLEFSDTIRGKSGEPVKRHWIVTGADKFGLPTASDDEVLLGLLKLTVQGGFDSGKIYFTRYELLKILRWTTEGRSYHRLQNALDRLSGVRIKATNAFFDNESKAHSTRNFGIVDAYEINHAGESHAKPSFFIWSEVLFKSFQVGFIKKLDLDFYLSLQSAVTKRLYRYLDKHFWYKSKLQIGLFTLAHEKIGISRNYKFASSLRQQLDPAVEELTKCGFVSAHEYVGKGSGTEIIFYAASKTPRYLQRQGQSENALAEKDANLHQHNQQNNEFDKDHASHKPAGKNDLLPQARSAIIERLVDRGIREAQAQRLLDGRSQDSLDRIARIIDHYDGLISSGSRLVSRSPVGFLYRAIEHPEAFALPDERLHRGKQGSFSFSEQAPAPKNARLLSGTSGKSAPPGSPKRGSPNEGKDLKSDYLVARKLEAQKLMSNIEPELLAKLKGEVQQKLVRLRDLISSSGFEDTVQHGIEEKLLSLFAFPDFDEWARSKRRQR